MTGTGQSGQRVLLVTGPSGAGRSTVLHALEDLSYEIIDNLPFSLIPRLLDGPPLSRPVALGIDVRNRDFSAAGLIELIDRLTRLPEIAPEVLYLDCRPEVLVRRYNETRRRHPLAQDLPAAAGIAAERELMEPLRRWADMVISTTQFTSNDLQQAIRERFLPGAPQTLTVSITSFGFARGMPPIADLVDRKSVV